MFTKEKENKGYSKKAIFGVVALSAACIAGLLLQPSATKVSPDIMTNGLLIKSEGCVWEKIVGKYMDRGSYFTDYGDTKEACIAACAVDDKCQMVQYEHTNNC